MFALIQVDRLSQSAGTKADIYEISKLTPTTIRKIILSRTVCGVSATEYEDFLRDPHILS